MRCPTLRELPAPPPGKTGWPWTEETQPLPDTMPEGGEWPKISIVTPNYNYGQFIEETIRSVLLQGYPNLEYIVIDGGSTDDSVEIIKKYEPWLSYWVSEKDKGQANAINKGIKLATGQIAAYLNSDDYYLNGAFNYIGKIFELKKFDILVGRNKTNIRKPKYWFLRRSYWLTKIKLFKRPFIFGHNYRYELAQESIVWNHSRYQNFCFDERYHFCLDVWWFVQIYSNSLVVHTSRRIGYFRCHIESKSSTIQDVCKSEIENIVQRTKNWKILSKKQALKILFQYYCISIQALFCKLLVPYMNLTFQYYHPPYIKEE